MANEAQRRKFKNRLSVQKLGVGLAGLDGVNQKLGVSHTAKNLLTSAMRTSGIVHLSVTGDQLTGVSIKTTKKTWEEKLDEIQKHVKVNEPGYFVLFRSEKDCLIITYVPDTAKPFYKMVYASSKESVKDAVSALGEEMNMEEFNTSEIEDISFEKYNSKFTKPKPYTEAEIARQEHDKAVQEGETAGGYGALARIIAMQNGENLTDRDVKSGASGAAPMALPGLSGGMGRHLIQSVKLKPINSKKLKRNAPPPAATKSKGPSPAKPKVGLKEFIKTVETKEPKKKTMTTKKKTVTKTRMVKKTVTHPAKEVVLIKPAVGNDTVVVWNGPGEDDERVEEIEVEEEYEEEVEVQVPVEIDDILAPTAAQPSVQKPKLAPVKNFKPAEPEPVEVEDELPDDDVVRASGEPMAVNDGQKMPPNEAVATLPEAGASMGRLAMQPKKPSFFQRVSRLFRRPRPKKLTAEQIEGLSDSDGKKTIEELREAVVTGAFEDLDPLSLEQYLSSKAFSQETGISKASFYKLRKKDQDRIRKNMGLLN